MALKVFIRLAGLGDLEQPAPFFIYKGAKWTAVQHLLASYYGDICPDNLDVRYWDEEDYVILSSQEELEEAFRLAQDTSYLQLHVQFMDPTDSHLADRQPATSFSVDATFADHWGGKPLEEVPQRRVSEARSLDCSTPENSQPLGLEEAENFQSTLDTAPEQQNTLDVGGATAMDNDEEKPAEVPKKALKKAALKPAVESKTDPSPSENIQVLDYYLKCLGGAAASNTGVAASQPDAKDMDAERVDQVSCNLELAAHVMEKLIRAEFFEESADQEPTMLPGALSGANAIAIEMPEMEHHGTETAEPAEIAETGEVSTESSRDAETGFWMQPRLEAEVSAELRRRLSTLVTEKEHSQYNQLQKKHEHRSSRKDKKKKHRAAETSSEDTDYHRKGKSSSSHTSSSLLETLLKEESSSDTPPPLMLPSKKHERRSSHKSDSKKKRHSTDPLTEDSFIRYMTRFEAQLKKDMAKEVAKKTVHSVIKNFPKQIEGSETASNPPAISMKRAGFVHEDIICDCCDREIVGTRYICGNCPNYDLCEECEDIQPSFHDRTHVFIKLRRPCLKAGTRHGVRVPLLKRVIYDTKEEERKVDPDRLQVIMERMKGQEGQSRNNNNEDDGEGEEANYQQTQPSPLEEEQEEEQLSQAQEEHSCRVLKVDLADPTGCVDAPQLVLWDPFSNPAASMPVALDLTKKTEPLENKKSESHFCHISSDSLGGYDNEELYAAILHPSSLRNPAEAEESVRVPAVKPKQQWLREMSRTQDDGSDKEEGAGVLGSELKRLLEDGFVVCPYVQSCTGEQETCTEEKQVDGPPRRETSPASSIEVVDTEPSAVSQTGTTCHHCSSQPPHELNGCPLYPLKEGEKKECEGMSFEEWLNRNHTDIQEESEDASSFTSLSDALSGDEDFVVITPDCFDTSKPLDPDRFSMLCKKAERWNTAGNEQKEDEALSDKKEDEAHSDKQEEEEPRFNKQEGEPLFNKQEEPLLSDKREDEEPLSDEQEEEQPGLDIPPFAAMFNRSPETFTTVGASPEYTALSEYVQLMTQNGIEKVVIQPFSGVTEPLCDANGNGAAENHQNTLSEDTPPCSSPVREGEEEAGAREEEEEHTTTLQAEVQVPAAAEPDVNQNVACAAAVSHSTPEREEPLMEQQVSEEPSTKGQVSEVQNRSLGDPTDEDVEDSDDDDADVEETDLKRFPQSDEEGAAAASDGMDQNQPLNQMMTNTIKKASNGLQTLFQTGRDIFRTFQRGDSYEYQESSYEYKPSDYKLPESTWQPSNKEYVPPKSNFQLVKSEYQIPKSTFTGPQSQVPAGMGVGGEYAGPLQRIREMGYFNNEHILALLRKHAGDVQKVVNDLVEEADHSWAEQRHGVDRS